MKYILILLLFVSCKVAEIKVKTETEHLTVINGEVIYIFPFKTNLRTVVLKDVNDNCIYIYYVPLHAELKDFKVYNIKGNKYHYINEISSQKVH